MARDYSTVELLQVTLEGLQICRSLEDLVTNSSEYPSRRTLGKSYSALQRVISMLQDEVARREAQGECPIDKAIDDEGIDVVREYPVLETELDLDELNGHDLSHVRDGLFDFAYDLGKRLSGSERWVETSKKGVQTAIADVASALRTVLDLVRTNNQLNAVDAIDPIERSQLIALLEAALAELKAPYIDRSRWGTVLRSIQRMLGKAIESGVGSLVEQEFNQALSSGHKLADRLAREEARPDLPFL